MTVTYTHKSHTAGCIGGLTRLLFIWKGKLQSSEATLQAILDDGLREIEKFELDYKKTLIQIMFSYSPINKCSMKMGASFIMILYYTDPTIYSPLQPTIKILGSYEGNELVGFFVFSQLLFSFF